jgi:hypothetical protein
MHINVIKDCLDNMAAVRQIWLDGSTIGHHFNQTGVLISKMKKLLALVMLVFAFAVSPALAQNVEFDIYDKSDFDKQLASNKPVIVHINTTW